MSYLPGYKLSAVGCVHQVVRFTTYAAAEARFATTKL
jgi:hypothetical protein